MSEQTKGRMRKLQQNHTKLCGVVGDFRLHHIKSNNEGSIVFGLGWMTATLSLPVGIIIENCRHDDRSLFIKAY